MQDTAGIFLISCNRIRLFPDMMDVSMLIQNAKEGCGMDDRQLLRQLQEQLDAISSVYTAIPDISPDGIYGPATAEAVRKFQSIFGLPQTGVVDLLHGIRFPTYMWGLQGLRNYRK